MTRRRAQPWLGTLVAVGIVELDGAAEPAFDAAFAAVRRVHEAMSPQRPPSDLARFNAAAAGAVIDCDRWTLPVLAAARELGEASGGVFDVSLGSGGLGAWGLHGGALLKHADGAVIDLGGIAKGEAVDRACEALRDRGVRAGWVNAGGDLRVFGDLGLPIHLRDADDAAELSPLLELRDGAIATSVFAPECYPATRHRRVTVAAPSCRWADALTKVVALASPDLGAALLARYHAQAFT